jgi:hypothetical protein
MCRGQSIGYFPMLGDAHQSMFLADLQYITYPLSLDFNGMGWAPILIRLNPHVDRTSPDFFGIIASVLRRSMVTRRHGFPPEDWGTPLKGEPHHKNMFVWNMGKKHGGYGILRLAIVSAGQQVWNIYARVCFWVWVVVPFFRSTYCTLYSMFLYMAILLAGQSLII